MKRNELRPDPELRDWLRRFDSPDSDSATRREALARRILNDAEPVLAARRGAPPTWWEVAAAWSRTLVPLGIATAVAATAFILWNARTPRPTVRPLTTSDSLVGALHRDHTSRHLVDLLVSPSAAPDTRIRK